MENLNKSRDLANVLLRAVARLVGLGQLWRYDPPGFYLPVSEDEFCNALRSAFFDRIELDYEIKLPKGFKLGFVYDTPVTVDVLASLIVDIDEMIHRGVARLRKKPYCQNPNRHIFSLTDQLNLLCLLEMTMVNLSGNPHGYFYDELLKRVQDEWAESSSEKYMERYPERHPKDKF